MDDSLCSLHIIGLFTMIIIIADTSSKIENDFYLICVELKQMCGVGKILSPISTTQTYQATSC